MAIEPDHRPMLRSDDVTRASACSLVDEATPPRRSPIRPIGA
jgi:hypothetical protein